MVGRRFLIALLLIFNYLGSTAQIMDPLIIGDSLNKNTRQLPLKLKPFIIPAVLISYGAIGIHNHSLKTIDANIQNAVVSPIDKKITIDDFTQYAPALSVYGLGAMGIKGKNNLRDKSIILSTSYLLMGITVFSLKHLTRIQRPDQSSFDSFPSGHTATAFLGAEFLYQEYKDVSIWYGISGYIVAAGTGGFRIYNNRHWFTDVVAGAGIGILSTKAAYWLYPAINKLLVSKKISNKKTTFIPYYDGRQLGIGLMSSF